MISYFQKRASEALVYHRPLPTGGYVAIATQRVQPSSEPSKVRGHIVVERRSAARRVGHAAPIVAVTERDDIVALLSELMPLAESDELLEQKLSHRPRTTVARKRLLA